MKTKQCSGCGVKKPITEFTNRKGSSDGYNARCRKCTQAFAKRHYDENRGYYLTKARKKEAAYFEWFSSLKEGRSCEQCGESHPACLDFHHRDPSKKEFDLGMVKRKQFAKQRVLDEIAKCAVLCSNCHRKLHWEERHVRS